MKFSLGLIHNSTEEIEAAKNYTNIRQAFIQGTYRQCIFEYFFMAQRLTNLVTSVLVQSMESSNVELGLYLDGRLFKCCLSVAANPEGLLDLIRCSILVVGSVLI